jgi:hypothetical protein
VARSPYGRLLAGVTPGLRGGAFLLRFIGVGRAVSDRRSVASVEFSFTYVLPTRRIHTLTVTRTRSGRRDR